MAHIVRPLRRENSKYHFGFESLWHLHRPAPLHDDLWWPLVQETRQKMR